MGNVYAPNLNFRCHQMVMTLTVPAHLPPYSAKFLMQHCLDPDSTVHQTRKQWFKEDLYLLLLVSLATGSSSSNKKAVVQGRLVSTFIDFISNRQQFIKQEDSGSRKTCI